MSLPCAALLFGAACGSPLRSFANLDVTSTNLGLSGRTELCPTLSDHVVARWNSSPLAMEKAAGWSTPVGAPFGAQVCSEPSWAARAPEEPAEVDVIEVVDGKDVLRAEFPVPSVTFEWLNPSDGVVDGRYDPVLAGNSHAVLSVVPEEPFRTVGQFQTAQYPPMFFVACEGLTPMPDGVPLVAARYGVQGVYSLLFSVATPIPPGTYHCSLAASYMVNATSCGATHCSMSRSRATVFSASNPGSPLTFDVQVR